jgi:hypothetical protein
MLRVLFSEVAKGSICFPNKIDDKKWRIFEVPIGVFSD